MKILITGGAGFIGSALALRLAKRYRITIADNFHHYYSIDRKRRRAEEVIGGGSNIQLVEADLRDEAAAGRLFHSESFDAVYHLAAVPGVTASITAPHLYIDANVKGTVNVLRHAGEAGVKHVLFASSSSVYGDREGVALSEQAADGRVISPYAATKVGGEAMCHTYAHLYGYRITILRFFTVYGPWGRPDMAIAGFIRKLMKGEPLSIFGGEHEISARDYTYIEDITSGLELALHSPEPYGVYNLGGGDPVPMSRLLEIFRTHYPDMRIDRKPWRAGDVHMTWADNAKAERLLGYRPAVSIEEGIARTVRWAHAHPELV